MQFKGKLMNQTWENGKKTSFEPNISLFGANVGPKIFLWALILLVVRHCFKLSFYAISRKTNEPILKKWEKASFDPDFGPFGTNVGPKTFLL